MELISSVSIRQTDSLPKWDRERGNLKGRYEAQR